MICVRTVDIGPYLLGAVSAEHRLELEQHLESCPTCREEVIRLAGLPGLLWRVPGMDLDESELDRPPSPQNGPSVPRRRRRGPLMALAAVLVLLGGTVAALDLTTGRPPPPSASSSVKVPSNALSASDPTTKVTAAAILTSQPWGTGVRLRLRGLPYGARCELVVRATDGSSDIAATWNAAYTRQLDIPAATDIDRANIASLEVTTDSQRLVTIPQQGRRA
jgi:hypothetical protein